ncbi:MAG: hypothetical protein QM755_24410 [Luteolibacter sp.]
MGKLIHILGASLVLSVTVGAQSMDPAASPSPAPAAATDPKKPAPTDKPATGGLHANETGSRYAGPDVSAYVESLATVFAIRSRTTDPFGQPQDIDAKPIKPKVTHAPTVRQAAIPPTPYSEIVSQIQVTTVIPGEERFLSGNRAFKKGDRFPILFRGRNYPTEIVEVTAERIVMKNQETGESGAIKLDMLPSGMTKGGKPGGIPGVQPSRADTPLEIESSPSSPGWRPPPCGRFSRQPLSPPL